MNQWMNECGLIPCGQRAPWLASCRSSRQWAVMSATRVDEGDLVVSTRKNTWSMLEEYDVVILRERLEQVQSANGWPRVGTAQSE